MSDTWVISLGGSLIAPDGIDTGYIRAFFAAAKSFLENDTNRKLILVVGGGKLARDYQSAFGEIVEAAPEDEKDWIGIAATRLNARLIKGVFGHFCADEVVHDPTSVDAFEGKVLVASGWKPGFSTDYDAVILAERFAAKSVINLTDVEKVYSADPRKNPDAVPYDRMTWTQFREIIGGEWTPGKNAPFDPIAARKASELSLPVIIAEGKNLDNMLSLLEGKPFTGTIIG